MNLALLVKAYREKRRFGVRKMAREIGISHTTLYHWERGREIKSHQLLKIYNWAMFGVPDAENGKITHVRD